MGGKTGPANFNKKTGPEDEASMLVTLCCMLMYMRYIDVKYACVHVVWD